MSVGSQAFAKAENPFALAFGISSFVFVLLAAVFLHALGVPLAAFALLLAVPVLLWMAFRFPIAVLGAVLAFMPVYPIAIVLGRFFGPPVMMSNAVMACDRIILLLLTCILWWRNGIKLKAPDWFLLACFGLAALRLALGGMLLALLSDFNLMIAYAAGRVAILTASQEKLWARRAVWIVAVLSVLGMTEVFIFGEGPRTILYSSITNGLTEGRTLGGSFYAEGFAGLRESATMLGPLQFASLCMVALIVWWVYRRNPLPGVAIAAGLVCSLTRSAWLGTALAIPLLAVAMEQRKRFLLYAALALALFIASIPVVGLGDYLFLTKTGQDYSVQGHQESVLKGLEYVLDHPFGSGPGNAGSYATKSNANGVFIESTYVTLAAEYGIPASLCFLGFLFSALGVVWRERTPRGYAAVGILVGFGAVMMVAPLHQDFNLASWIWFPVGLAIRSPGSASLS
jgi:O-Antigen ligase